MIDYYRAIRYRMGHDDPVATLETDVMRFVAIIVLCLLAIFALVQSMPISSENNQQRLQMKRLLEKEISGLKQQSDDLREKIRRLASHQEIKRSSAEKQIQIQTAEGELNWGRQELVEAQEDLVRMDDILTSAEKKMDEKQGDLGKVDKLIDQARQKEAEARKKLDQARNTIIPEKQREKSSSSKGYILRFASDKVLKGLLREKKIKFYMLAAGKSWNLTMNSSTGWRFVPGEPSGSFYQMDSRTVPGDFIQAAEEIGGLNRDKIDYGVVLPPAIRRELTKAMKNGPGGELIIGSDGRIILR